MNRIVEWFGAESGQALLLALGHSLWVGVILCLAAALLASLIPAKCARLRYGLFLSAQALLLVVTLAIWSLLDERSSQAEVADVGVDVSAAVADGADIAVEGNLIDQGALVRAIPDTGEPVAAVESGRPGWLAQMGLVWLAGALMILAARAVAMGRTHWYCRSGIPVKDPIWLKHLDFERARLRVRRTVALRAL